MTRKKYGKPTGRSKPKAKQGTAKEALKFAANPTGYAAKEVIGEVQKKIKKAKGGKVKRATYKHGGEVMPKGKPC
jgi:hypothetical protein